MALFSYQVGDERHQADRSWYRGDDCNFLPSKTNLAEPGAIRKYILHGWVPDSPVISRDATVLAVGSCFARHIVRYLRSLRSPLKINEGSDVNLFAFGAGFVNTSTLRQQFEWSLGRREITTATLKVEDRSMPPTGRNKAFRKIRHMPTDAATRRATRDAILAADAFILTLGLSEVWYEKDSGDVFFGAVPRADFDPDKHGFRVVPVEENLDNLRALVALLREFKPRAPVVLTLSPVPLIATFRPVSCITADSVSKSILRVAADELVRESGDDRLFYWPSYEIIREYYGPDAYQDDRRHVKPQIIDRIMGMFVRRFIESG